MKFLLTMNMPVRAGQMVHQVVCGYNCDSVESFLEIIDTQNFILVEEFYKDVVTHEYYTVGPIIINTNLIGKVRTFISKNSYGRET